MIQNPVESANALEKLADIVGKKTLVMWCIVTTFTTGYLFLQVSKTTESRITEQKAAYERIVEEVKGIRETTEKNTKSINLTNSKIDTTLIDAQETLNKLKNKR